MLFIVQWLHEMHNRRHGRAIGKQDGVQGDLWQCYKQVRGLNSASPSFSGEDFNGRNSPLCWPPCLLRLSFLGMKPTPFFLGGICTS